MLLAFMRDVGLNAIAMKPFCSGGRADAHLLSALQDHLVPLSVMNPFYFSTPLTPHIAAELEGRKIAWVEAKRAISKCLKLCDFLIIEGAGGLLSPLGRGYSFLKIATAFTGRIVIIASNRLGVLNQVLLTTNVLEANKLNDYAVVLIGQRHSGLTEKTNVKALREILGDKRILEAPFRRCNLKDINEIRKFSKIIKKTLACAVGIGRLDCVTRGTE